MRIKTNKTNIKTAARILKKRHGNKNDAAAYAHRRADVAKTITNHIWWNKVAATILGNPID